LVKLASSSFWSIQQQALQRINAAPATIDRQTYIGEAEESIDSEMIGLPITPKHLPENKTAPSEVLDVALISSGDIYQPPPMTANEWEGRTGLTGLSELYERTGAQLNAIHPLAILFTMLTLLCVALSLNTWINSTPKPITGNALSPNGLEPSPKDTPVVPPKPSPRVEASNYNRAINIANVATLASQSATTKQEWEKISVQWNKAISLLKAVPATDPKYPEAQERIENYQTLSETAILRAKRAT
jgi:hypothetical protein